PPEQLQLVVAAAARPIEGLWLGAGVQVLTSYGGEATFTAVLGTGSPGRVNSRSLDNEVTGQVAPVVGVAAGPFHGAQAFASFRGEHKTIFSMPVGVDLGGFGAIEVTVDGVMHFSPNTVVAGASAKLLGDRLLVAVDLGWEQWSKTPPMVAVIGIKMPGTLTALGFNPDVISRPVEMNFRDTLVPRVGAEWMALERVALRAGYSYRPSPIPDQAGRANFLDADTHVLSAGAGYAFDDPIGWAKQLWVEGGAQLGLLTPREVVKVGPNKSPNYRFGGAVLDLVLAARYRF
ncbi:MAG: OmpP1/FadL family transporter, partial [Myxococcaceae bacterium]